MIQRRELLRLLLLGPVLLGGCSEDAPEVRVDLSRRRGEVDPSATPEVRFAVGTMISPRESLGDYLALANYLESRIERPVRLVQRRGYAETNALLARGEVDMAFISTGPFVDARRAGATLLAVPVFRDTATTRALIIVRRDDPATSVEDLRGASFAFADPLSFTGRIYPEWLVKSLADGGVFFGRTVFTHSHSDSVAMVAESRIRAASVEEIVFEYLRRRQPERVEALRVLHASRPFPGPTFVARPRLPEDVRQGLRQALLGMHENPQGGSALRALGFERLESVSEASYDEVARMHDEVLGSAPEAPR